MQLTTVEVFKVVCTNGDTEYPLALRKPRRIRIQARAADARVAYRSGDVANPSTGVFTTVKTAQPPLVLDDLFGDDTTIYIASTTAGAVVEVEAWR